MAAKKENPIRLVSIHGRKERSLDGWQEFLSDGNAFLKTATAAYYQRKKTFTPEILYNIIAMAIEKFVMAAVMHSGDMPENHTMADLLRGLQKVYPDDSMQFERDLLQFDQYQEICDLDAFKIAPPCMQEIPAMLDLAHRLQDFVIEKIGCGHE